MMSNELIVLHLNAAEKSGIKASCTGKQWYTTYETAYKGSLRLNSSPNSRHPVEPYPCPYCLRWHIGRIMSLEELKKISPGT